VGIRNASASQDLTKNSQKGGYKEIIPFFISQGALHLSNVSLKLLENPQFASHLLVGFHRIILKKINAKSYLQNWKAYHTPSLLLRHLAFILGLPTINQFLLASDMFGNMFWQTWTSQMDTCCR